MPKLGQQVDVFCGRCKVERYHTVAAVSADGSIERVVCGYCQSSRKYKDPTPKTRAKRAPRAPAEKAIDADTPGKPYSLHSRFGKGDVLDHSKYGKGRVTEVRGDRIDVKFVDGETRTFLHGG